MKVMVIGSGGREHTIIKSLKKSPKITELYALPGNGGIAKDATCVNIKATDLEGAVKFAKDNGIDYAVVAPDDPLVLGMVDALNAVGVPCFGPAKNAAIIEGSKVFSKNLMKKYNIPTASYETFSDKEEALKYLDTAAIPTVVKADGLALGKGVIIAETREDAKAAVISMMEDKMFGESGSNVVIEEFLTGPEVSVLAFTDGKVVVPMVSSMDHKRALDGDNGLNTGGMGTIAPNPYYTDAIAAECMETIFIPTINAMNAEGRTFKGCLYFGLMLTPNGPKVIEYNCRFGDPETQVVLPLLESDLFEIMQAVTEERLSEVEVKFSDRSACCVIMASNGYPQKYETGFEITIPEGLDAEAYVAGGKLSDDGKLLTYPDIWKEMLREKGKKLSLNAVGGPCTSYELVAHDQTHVSFCGDDIKILERIKSVMETDYYHISITTDVTGIESAVALKNGYALGIAFTIGLNQKNFGDETLHFNSQAAVFGQATKEMYKLLNLQNALTLENLCVGVGDLYVTVYGGRTRLVGILLGKGLNIDESKEKLNGVTLESLVVSERVARAVKKNINNGILKKEDFPLLLHIDEILSDKKEVNIPWEAFTFVNEA